MPWNGSSNILVIRFEGLDQITKTRGLIPSAEAEIARATFRILKSHCELGASILDVLRGRFPVQYATCVVLIENLEDVVRQIQTIQSPPETTRNKLIGTFK